MAQQFTDTQRLAALDAYIPAQHLVQIKGKDGSLKDYYPAAYRLYELNLRYPNANFSTEILFMDLERDFCIVRARLYLGADYDLSEKKAEALKQGRLTQLDKVDTAAKARCCRDFGIGTEYALEFSEDDEMSAPTTGQVSQSETLATIKEQVKTLNLARNPSQWTAWKKTVLKQDVADNRLSAGQVAKLNAAIDQAKQHAA